MRCLEGHSRTALAMTLIVALLLLDAEPAIARLVNAGWIELVTPNYVIKSRLSQKKTVSLARDLELFRQVVVCATNVKDVRAAVPTSIVVMKGSGDWGELDLDREFAGYFTPAIRANYIVMRGRTGLTDTAVIQHEYVHFIVRNQNAMRFPMWFDEGFAEFLSSVEARRGRVNVSGVPRKRAESFSHMEYWWSTGFPCTRSSTRPGSRAGRTTASRCSTQRRGHWCTI